MIDNTTLIQECYNSPIATTISGFQLAILLVFMGACALILSYILLANIKSQENKPIGWEIR